MLLSSATETINTIACTIFQSRTNPLGEQCNLRFDDLCNWIDNVSTADKKDDLHLIKLATFEGDHRNDDNLLQISGIEGDYDGEVMPASTAAALLKAADVNALVYTTPSYRPNAPRWRVLAPLSAPAAPAQRHALVGKLNAILGGVLASESWTASQAFYVGGVKGGHPVQSWRIHGKHIDTLDIAPVGPAQRDREGGRRYKPGGGRRAPSYSVALDALRSRDPDDFDRNGWLTFGGAFFAATHGLASDEQRHADWLAWNSSYQGNDPDGDGKAWRDFERHGSNGDFNALADMGSDGNAKGWRWFNGTVRPTLPPVPHAPRASLLTALPEAMSRQRPTPWIMKGILPARSAGIMFGQPKTGKSFVAIDWSARVASGTAFDGRKVRGGRVVYIAGEGHRGVVDRFTAWFRENRRAPDRDRIHVSDRALSFVGGDDLPTLIAEMDVLPTSPTLIVVDTLFRATAGADVNDAREMNQFWSAVETLKARYGATVLVVHHSGRNETQRSFGSIVLLANVDFEMAVTVESDGAKRIENTAQKDAEEFEPIYFRLKTVFLRDDIDPEDGEIETVTSCVIDISKQSDGDRKRDTETRKNVAQTMPAAPSAKSQQKAGAIIARIHDEACRLRGIALSETPLADFRIPFDVIARHAADMNFTRNDVWNGVRGLADPQRKRSRPFADLDETRDRNVTPRASLLIWARADGYDVFENLQLTDNDRKLLNLPM